MFTAFSVWNHLNIFSPLMRKENQYNGGIWFCSHCKITQNGITLYRDISALPGNSVQNCNLQVSRVPPPWPARPTHPSFHARGKYHQHYASRRWIMLVGVVAVPYGHSSATHLILYRVFWRGGNITVQSYSVLSYFLTAAGQTPRVRSFLFWHERREPVWMGPFWKLCENHMFPKLFF